MELAVFGRARNEADRRLEQAQRRLATFAAPGGPWEVKDVSQTGFRLLAPMSVANAVTLGTLAAIRPHGQPMWALGIVRRMKRLTADRAEIGLQVIANTLVGVELIEQREIGRRRLFGRWRSDDGQRTEVRRPVPVAQKARNGPRRAIAHRSGGRVPAGQALQGADVALDQRDPLRSPARAAARVGLDRRRAASLPGLPQRKRRGRDAEASGNVPPIATPRSIARTAGRFPPDSTSRTRAAVAGRPIEHASRCTGKMRPGATAACTFWDLQQQANRLSNALAALGVARGDRVALVLPQRPETVVAHIAVYQMGAVSVPLSFLFGPDALEYRLNHSGAKVALVDPQSLPNLLPIRERCPGLTHVIGVAGAREASITPYETALEKASSRFAPVVTSAADPAILVYTSGTTGPPKGALMPQQCLIGNLPGFVHSHDGYPRERRPLLVARRLGVDGRPHGRAAAGAVFRPADRRLSRTLRPRTRIAR